MRRWLWILPCVVLLSGTVAVSQACVWGSFDATRINYESGTLNGAAHSVLRGIITGQGNTVAPGTPTLTAEYLAGVDVFYTSLLSTATGVLSTAEQIALHDWITNGGTLIVTADIFPLPAYESFTAYYGVTGYQNIGEDANGTPVAQHPITQGVGSFYYMTQSTFSYGSDALLLAVDAFQRNFLIVMEPGTGFDAGGRIVVVADHNMFTDSFIGEADNLVLATNIVSWANCEPQPVPVETATWGRVKALFH